LRPNNNGFQNKLLLYMGEAIYRRDMDIKRSCDIGGRFAFQNKPLSQLLLIQH
jgi:hypothetical protein